MDGYDVAEVFLVTLLIATACIVAASIINHDRVERLCPFNKSIPDYLVGGNKGPKFTRDCEEALK